MISRSEEKAELAFYALMGVLAAVIALVFLLLAGGLLLDGVGLWDSFISDGKLTALED